jgi:endonuclease/exonuclease/phosphatase family metal-dependent hydrolase
MSYNIAAGHGDLDRTGAAIRSANPDLVALQEVDVHWNVRSAFVDQATALGAALGMEVCFAHIYKLPPTDTSKRWREYGVAVLSRFKIERCENHPLTRLSTQAEGTPPSLMPGFLEAHVVANGVRLRVFDTHLDYRPDPAVRRQQVAEMLERIGNAATPTLLMGDLNATPRAPELAPLLQRLRDAWTGPDSGLTYPADVPAKRIDYVLTSAHVRVRDIRVPTTTASDHRPVVADLVVAVP